MARKRGGAARSRAPRLAPAGQRDRLVDQVSLILRRGKTAWEHDAACRQAVRIDLLTTHPKASWHLAQAEADKIVDAALRRIGAASRPRPDEHVEKILECLHCGAPADDRFGGYCSFACGIVAVEFGAVRDRFWRFAAPWEATFTATILRRQRIVERGRFPLTCQNPDCPRPGRGFMSQNPKAKYCSQSCRGQAHTRYGEVPCGREGCPERIIPYNGRRYCSRQCAREAIAAAIPDIECALEGCTNTVHRKTVRNRFCCPEHAVRYRNLQRAARRAEKRREAPIPVCALEGCTEPVTRPNARFCCRAHSQKHHNAVAAQRKAKAEANAAEP